MGYDHITILVAKVPALVVGLSPGRPLVRHIYTPQGRGVFVSSGWSFLSAVD